MLSFEIMFIIFTVMDNRKDMIQTYTIILCITAVYNCWVEPNKP